MASVAQGGPATRRPERAAAIPDELPACLAAGEHALTESGDLRASRESFGRAYELAELAGEPEAMALAVLGLAGLWVGERRTATGMAMLETRLQHALSLLGGQSSLALRIRARLAAEADYRRGTHGETLSVLAEARAAEDPLALAEALSLVHHCLLGPGNVALRGELAAELIRVSFRTGRRSDRLVRLLWQTADAYAAGDMHAGRLLGELRDELRERDHAAVGFVISAIDVMLAIRAGRLDDAESLAAICADSGAAAGDIDRIRRLDAELDKLTPGSDADHAARAEREWLMAQLASAAGLGRRPRSFPDDRERARVAVGKAIRRALARIAVADAGHSDWVSGGRRAIAIAATTIHTSSRPRKIRS